MSSASEKEQGEDRYFYVLCSEHVKVCLFFAENQRSFLGQVMYCWHLVLYLIFLSFFFTD